MRRMMITIIIAFVYIKHNTMFINAVCAAFDNGKLGCNMNLPLFFFERWPFKFLKELMQLFKCGERFHQHLFSVILLDQMAEDGLQHTFG